MMTYKKYIIVCALFFSTHIFGYGLPSLGLGYTNILDGGPVRPYPGVYWQQWLQYYTTQRFLDNKGKPLGGVTSPRYRLFGTVAEFIYQCEHKVLLRGMPGFVMALPVTFLSKINHNALGIESSGGGIGNFGCGVYTQWPCIERKGRPLFIHRLEVDLVVPLGKNKLPEKQINPNDSFVSIGLNWAATLYFSWKWSTSWALHYVWSAHNEKIDFKAGDAIYCNYSLAYQVHPKVYLGAVGYALQQLHNNQELGLSVAGSKERVFGIGPGFGTFITKDMVFFTYLYLEAGARNRTQGTNFIMRLIMHF
jgi:hypothetical protein